MDDRIMVQQARQPVPDLLTRRGWIYWLDFTLTAILSWLLVAVYFTAEPWPSTQLLARQLPPDHPYHRCNRKSYFTVIGDLLAGAVRNRQRRGVIARWQAGN